MKSGSQKHESVINCDACIQRDNWEIFRTRSRRRRSTAPKYVQYSSALEGGKLGNRQLGWAGGGKDLERNCSGTDSIQPLGCRHARWRSDGGSQNCFAEETGGRGQLHRIAGSAAPPRKGREGSWKPTNGRRLPSAEATWRVRIGLPSYLVNSVHILEQQVSPPSPRGGGELTPSLVPYITLLTRCN